MDAVKAMDSGSNPEKVICLIAAVIRAAPQDSGKWLPVALDFYVKGVLLPKVRPPQHVIVSCFYRRNVEFCVSTGRLQAASESFLKSATHETFKETLLPSVKKAMLRSPEIAVHGWKWFNF